MIDYSRSSEEKLIKAVIKGDSQAYGELYKRYLDEIYRYVYYRVAGNHLEAEDLIQIVFIRAWEVMLRNKPKNYNFRALVYRIAHNLTIDRWRTQKQEYSLEAKQFETLKSTAPTPEQSAKSNEEIDSVTTAIKGLDPKLQQVFICRFINGLSHSETAKTLGLTESHVRVLQYRALKRIRLGTI